MPADSSNINASAGEDITFIISNAMNLSVTNCALFYSSRTTNRCIDTNVMPTIDTSGTSASFVVTIPNTNSN